MNNRGFTLVELIATILVLGIIMSIATYSITSVLKKAKEENYNLLVKNIKDGAEVYYQECKYSSNAGVSCIKSGNYYETTIGNLVNYGFIKGNGSSDDSQMTIVNPKDDVDIASCRIRVTMSNGAVLVEAVSPSGSCPTSY